MKKNYFLFKKFKNKYLLTNEMGYSIFLENQDFIALIKSKWSDLNKNTITELIDKMFIYDCPDEVFVEHAIRIYRENKKYIFSATSLHIFVLTNSCNMCCVYCQAQDSEQEVKGVMSSDVAKRAVDIALQSPNDYLTFEFQGGEPLINFQMIKEIVEYAIKNKKNKEIYFTAVTNTLLLTDEMIDFFAKYHISISTSLDGDIELHNINRPKKNGGGTFDCVQSNIRRLRDKQIDIGAIQTTTRASLNRAKKIIHTYMDMGLDCLFIRPLTPLGYAKEHWGEIGYNPEEFIVFYREVLDEIIRLNISGNNIQEGHALIFLKKILCQAADNYMELRSPCGASVGQVAYYYDGNIYTCDEGRMLSEMGMTDFKLGSVFDSNYDELMDNDVCKLTCQASVLESIPGCAECVYMPYCGVCPVVNYASENNIYSREINNYKCKIYKGMLDIIFDLLDSNQDARIVFERWMGNEK